MKSLLPGLFLATLLFSNASTPAWAADLPEDLVRQIDQLKADSDAHKDTPKEIPGLIQVGTEEAGRLRKAKGAIFLDNRVKAQFDAEKIDGAVWFPVDELLKDPSIAAKLDKSKKYVAYCNGVHCWRSPAAAMVLKSLGFTNVLWYRDGLPEWKKSGLPTE